MNKLLIILLALLVLNGAIIAWLGVMIADQTAETLQLRHEKLLQL